MRLLLSFLCIFSLVANETQVLDLETGPLAYKADLGSIPVKDKVEISYIAYVKESPENGRPITFTFNGGPGSSSVWLHLGTFGPKRVLSPEEGQAKVPPYEIVENQETILDLTDLVFIDPVGTGFSTGGSLEESKPYYDVQGDVKAVGDFIRDYLTKHKRWNSPIYLAGESYGTCRAAGLADYLQSEHGIYLNGLVLISCALDFRTLLFDANNPLPYLLFFPTYVTTAWHHGKYRPEATLEEVAEEAEAFAYESYAPFLLSSRLPAHKKEALFEKFSEMTGIPLREVRKENGKIDEMMFFVRFFSDEKKTIGRFDSRTVGDYTGFFPSEDPSHSEIKGIFSTALHNYLTTEFDAKTPYKIFSEEAHRNWNFYSGQFQLHPDFLSPLKLALVANPNLKVFIGSGYFDLATPFATTDYCIDQLDLPESYQQNFQTEYYEGGHMYYLNPSERKKFKEDLVHFYQGKR